MENLNIKIDQCALPTANRLKSIGCSRYVTLKAKLPHLCDLISKEKLESYRHKIVPDGSRPKQGQRNGPNDQAPIICKVFFTIG